VLSMTASVARTDIFSPGWIYLEELLANRVRGKTAGEDCVYSAFSLLDVWGRGNFLLRSISSSTMTVGMLMDGVRNTFR
jgi:hypothetical protein